MKPLDLLVICDYPSEARVWAESQRKNCRRLSIMSMIGEFNDGRTWKIISKQHAMWSDHCESLQFKDFLLIAETTLTFEEDALVRSRLRG